MTLHEIVQPLIENLLTPIPLCFALGVFCRLIHGGIKIPKELYYTIAIFLLMSIGFIGGHELAVEVIGSGVSRVWKPALVTLFLGCLTPITSYLVLRYIGRMTVADSAGIAAHYGSTSAVTYAVANTFVEQQMHTADPYMQTLVTILECPGIVIALALGALFRSRDSNPEATPGDEPKSRMGEALYEVLTSQSIMLLAGMLLIGFVATFAMKEPPLLPAVQASQSAVNGAPSDRPSAPRSGNAAPADSHSATSGGESGPEHGGVTMQAGFKPFEEFFRSKGMLFRGALCIFLLEMGLVAGERLKDLLRVGPFLVSFGVFMPLIHGFLGAYLGRLAGLNLGGCTVFAAIVSSASYIAAPPAVRLTLPEANPTLSITAALAITFPFNIAIGIPIYYQMARFVGAQ
jgi:hypothetical protein